MRLAKGIAAAACLLVGLWLMLRAAGLLTGVLSAVPRWWPALPAAAGLAILVRSPRPGPHRRLAIVLLGASGLGFAIVHHALALRVWPFAAGAGLVAAGFALAYMTARADSTSVTDQTQRIVVAFKSTQLQAASADLARIRVYLFCGRLELDITDCLSPGSLPDEPLMIEIVACLGNVKVVAPDETVYPHKAFVMRFGKETKGEVLRDESTNTAHAVAASMAFLGSVTVPPWNQSTVSPED
jgi:hypothetical protein